MAKKSIGKLDFSFKDNGLIWRWNKGKTHRIGGKAAQPQAEEAQNTSYEMPDQGDSGYYEDNGEYTEDQQAYGDESGMYDENGYEYDDNGAGYDENGYSYDENGYAYDENGYIFDVNGNPVYRDGEYEEGYSDDGYYEGEDGGYYEDGGEYGDGGYEPQDGYTEAEPEQKGWRQFLMDNDWVMYIALIVFPPLGIYLLWKKQKFDLTVRSAITAASLIWFILLLWLLFFNKSNSTSDPLQNPQINAATIPPVAPVALDNPIGSATEAPGTIEVEPTATPAPTPRVNVIDSSNAADGNDDGYVWTTSTGAYYHNIDTCSNIGEGITPSHVTLSLATAQGKTMCPACYGQQQTGNEYYATSTGKYFHTDRGCTGMSGAEPVTEDAALAAGKSPCPTCVGYYCTPNGKYIHNRPNCTNMTGAQLLTKAEITKLGNKDWCPICFPTKKSAIDKETFTYVYATQGGTNYHTDANCRGMKDANKVKITTALAAGKTACSTCVSNNTLYVYATSGGTYYHIDASCSGMNGASRVTITAAMAKNKTACPTCAKLLSTATGKGGKSSKDALGGASFSGVKNSSSAITSGDTETYVYARSDGTYYHTNATCSGMKGASKVKINSAITAGKKACPTCVSTSKVYVFATTTGKYYHTDSSCSGMKGALRVTMQAAINKGKAACPTCAKNLISGSSSAVAKKTSAAAPSISPATLANTTAKAGNTASKPTSTYVYARSDGTYYHTKANCSGMKNPSAVKLTSAVKAGKKPCPTCVSASTLHVFATKDGNYYHTNATCSGMKNASYITVQTAKNNGKIVCPKCGESTLSKQTSNYAASASTKVYVKTSSSKTTYHKAKNCDATGMSGGTAVTLQYALDFSYTACKYCNPPTKVSK